MSGQQRAQGKVYHTSLPGTKTVATVAELVTDFLADLVADGKAKGTVKAYGGPLRAFAAGWEGEARAVTAVGLREHLRAFEASAPATKAKQRCALRAFFRWAVELGHLDVDPAAKLPRVRVPDAQPRGLEPKVAEKAIANADNLRDRLAFQLMLDTGCRASEALGVRLEDIRLHAQEVTVMGKQSRERTLYLMRTEALGQLRRYLRAQGWLAKDGETVTGKGWLFRPDEGKQRAGKPGGHLTYSVAEKAWRRACALAGVEATLHQLRHTFATEKTNKGLDLQVLQRVLGHRNPQTTQRYGRVSDQTVRRALEGL